MKASLSFCIFILYCSCEAKQTSVSTYNREITLYNVEIILSKQLTTRRGSLVYAVCQQSAEYLFDRIDCNVTIESPLFSKSVDNNTCNLRFASVDRDEKLTELKLHILNDHKVLFTWSAKSPRNNWRTFVRLLTFSACKFTDFSLPIRNFAHVIARKAGFDLIVNYHDFCESMSHCKLSYDSNAKKISGPIKILYDSDVPLVIPKVQPFLQDGFLLAGMTPRGYVVDVEPDGKLKPLMAINIPRDQTLRAAVSSHYGFYSLCAFVNSSTVTCFVYDPRTSFRMNATLEFDDRRESNDTRWIAMRNTRGKSLILATGKVSQNSGNADNFTVIKLHSDGRWGKAIHIDGIDFKGVDEFHARLSRNKLDDLCFHFIGKQNKNYQYGTINRLKLAIKCLSKSYVNADNLLVIN